LLSTIWQCPSITTSLGMRWSQITRWLTGLRAPAGAAAGPSRKTLAASKLVASTARRKNTPGRMAALTSSRVAYLSITQEAGTYTYGGTRSAVNN